MSIILAIGAHFDDIESGCAGTLVQHVARGDVVYFGITSGDETRTGHPHARSSEQCDSLGYMCIPEENCNIALMHMSIPEVVARFDRIKPDIIYAQFEFDTHQDHIRSSRIAQAVGRKRHINTLFYDAGSTYGFLPNIFVPIDFDYKEKILLKFQSQIPHSLNINYLRKREAHNAAQIGLDGHAEAFMTRKMRYTP